MKQSSRPRLALALLVMLALAWMLPEASRANLRPAPRAIAIAATAAEKEPNNTIDTATFIALDPVAGVPNTLSDCSQG